MIKLLGLIYLSTFLCFTGFAQNSYSVSSIPASLLVNANLVKRTESMRLEIRDSAKAYLHQKYALTILNSAGDEAAGFAERSDKLVTLQNVDGTLYDESGKKIKSLKHSDLQDLSGTGDESLITDSRIKAHNFNWKIYPYTVEYEITFEFNGIFYLPPWQPIEEYHESVQSSSLKVECPSNYKIRYLEKNLANNLNSSIPKISTVSIETNHKNKVYTWNAENLPALESEKYSPRLSEVSPMVHLAPSSFSIYHHIGEMSNWINFGKFQYDLSINRNLIPENVKLKIHALTDNLSGTREKVNAIYHFLQRNTRYISIQLGIGGWQPFDANSVAQKGYGDCKALSNYMYSLLKEIGIKSNYVLINGGYSARAVNIDFPSVQFNHMILCVPEINGQSKDTIWLECTSQTLPTGYLSSFTSNRYCILIDEKGGVLAHTPIYKKEDNIQIRKIIAKVDSDGNLNASINTRFQAEQTDDLHEEINGLSKEKVEELLKQRLNIPTYDILSYNYREENNNLPIIHERLEVKASNYCTVSGKRIFICPNILNKSISKIPSPDTRKQNIIIPSAFVDIDTIELNIPLGYFPESIPKNNSVTNKFGSYHSELIVKSDKVVYIRNSQRNSGLFPAKDAIVLSEFYDTIFKADREKLVMVKKGKN